MTDVDVPLESEEGEVTEPEQARRNALLTDFLSGIGGIAVGFLEARGALVRAELVGVGIVLCVTTITALYAVEHDAIPGVFPEVAALASLALLGAVGLGLVYLIAQPLNLTVAAVLVGFGVGIVTYRTMFGIVRPVPQSRLERAS